MREVFTHIEFRNKEDLETFVDSITDNKEVTFNALIEQPDTIARTFSPSYEYETEAERIEITNRDFGEFNFKIQLSEDEDFDDSIESALEESTDLSGNWTYEIEVLKKY